MDNQKHTPGPYTVSNNSGSYQNIFLDGKIWIGSVENGLAIEICNKLNQRLELLQENELLKEQKEYWKNCKEGADEVSQVVIDKQAKRVEELEQENKALKQMANNA